jgi:hypothetical protein
MRELTLLEDKVKGKSIALKVLRSAQDESPKVNSGGARIAPSVNWQDSPPIQRLLDVISSILAEEYIMIAKQNPKVFSDIASGKMGQSPSLRLRSGQAGTVPIFPHNDGRQK